MKRYPLVTHTYEPYEDDSLRPPGSLAWSLLGCVFLALAIAAFAVRIFGV